MHSSSTASMRPRQRTFTSCTECRRRKQRCNQAKDRPCNNCSRRYPPVICTYESSSPPPSIDRVVDLRDVNSAARDDAQHTDGRTNVVPGPAYQQTSQVVTSNSMTTTADQTYYNASGYYAPSTTRPDYRDYSGDTPSSQYVATSNAGDYVPLDGGYYPDDRMHYGGQDYYANQDAQGNWLSANGDPGAFVGAGNPDYYFVCDPEQGHSRTPAPRR